MYDHSCVMLIMLLIALCVLPILCRHRSGLIPPFYTVISPGAVLNDNSTFVIRSDVMSYTDKVMEKTISTVPSIREESTPSFFNRISETQEIHFTVDGLVDVNRTRINFYVDSWQDHYERIKYRLQKVSFKSNEEMDMFVEKSNGYSNMLLEKDHAIISNACLSRNSSNIYIHDLNDTLVNRTLLYLNASDFYYNEIEVKNSSYCSINSTSALQHVFVFRAPQSRDLFYFLQRHTLLLRIALHPEQYPEIKTWISMNRYMENLDPWLSAITIAMLDIFGDRKPVQIDTMNSTLFPTDTEVCDPYLVLMRSWDYDDEGYMFAEPLAADLLRASIYKQYNILPVMKKKDDPLVIMVADRDNRRILNFRDLFWTIFNRFRMNNRVLDKSIDAHFQQSIRYLHRTDILISPHCHSLSNLIFLLPNSYLLELIPPSYHSDRFKNLATSVGVFYSFIDVFDSNAKCGGYNSSDCSIEDIRNQKFFVNSTIVMKKLEGVTKMIWKMKYLLT